MSITSVSVPSTVTTVTEFEITKFLQSWHLLLIQLLIFILLKIKQGQQRNRHPCELFVSHYKLVGLKELVASATATTVVICGEIYTTATICGESYRLRRLYHIGRGRTRIGVESRNQILVLLCL